MNTKEQNVVNDGRLVSLVDVMGNDMTVVNAARVSYGKSKSQNEQLSEADCRLIDYLARHGHWTPFAHGMLMLRFMAPIVIARQWFKHQIGITRNEVSRRYVDNDPIIGWPSEVRGRPVLSKQGSGDALPVEMQKRAQEIFEETGNRAFWNYNALLDMGVAPEQARFVLPQATVTEWIETGSLAAYARVYRLRAAGDAQKETQVYAQKVAEIATKYFPESWKALVQYQRMAA